MSEVGAYAGPPAESTAVAARASQALCVPGCRLTLLMSWLLALLPLIGCVESKGTKPVTINFKAVVGGTDFSCDQVYSGLGTAGSPWVPGDFRLYVHDLRLATPAGGEAPIQLDDDGQWQDGTVALLDFEDGGGTCTTGDPALHFTARGRVAADALPNLRFTIGVPESENHLNVTTERPPLNLSALYWTWTLGYMFVRLQGTFSLHLGSAGCVPVDANNPGKGVAGCANPNRPEVSLAGFDPAINTVVFDVAALFATTDLAAFGSVASCSANPGEATCDGIFTALGLGSAAQTFVSME